MASINLEKCVLVVAFLFSLICYAAAISRCDASSGDSALMIVSDAVTQALRMCLYGVFMPSTVLLNFNHFKRFLKRPRAVERLILLFINCIPFSMVLMSSSMVHYACYHHKMVMIMFSKGLFFCVCILLWLFYSFARLLSLRRTGILSFTEIVGTGGFRTNSFWLLRKLLPGRRFKLNCWFFAIFTFLYTSHCAVLVLYCKAKFYNGDLSLPFEILAWIGLVGTGHTLFMAFEAFVDAMKWLMSEYPVYESHADYMCHFLMTFSLVTHIIHLMEELLKGYGHVFTFVEAGLGFIGSLVVMCFHFKYFHSGYNMRAMQRVMPRMPR